jgi:putative FmdB family regulatory protein
MPLYEYQCLACDESFEALVAINRQAAVPCPHCRATEVRKLMSAFAARVADGSGGHRTAACSGGCGNCSSGGCGNCSCK